MKRLGLLLFFVTLAIILSSQSPQSFKYQAVVRDAAGVVLQNQNVSLRISILEGSVSGSTVYSEEHSATTNDFGLVNLEIGNGNVVSGDFSIIPWGSDSCFVQIELDENGGTAFQLMGVSQLLSVPYSLYAERSGMTDSTIWKRNAN
ncbi:MAG: collagen-like protein, partial [Bacteroidota bacterium]